MRRRSRSSTGAGGEANLVIPDLTQVSFLGGIPVDSLLMGGLVFCALGLLFGLVIYGQLKRMAVHKSMLEVSELIYETCKTYLITQGKFILILEVFIGFVIAALLRLPAAASRRCKVAIILLFSLVGIAGSYGVAWFGIRINTFANSRTAFASLRGKPYPVLLDSAQGGHEHRHAADQRRAGDDALHPAVHSRAITRARASSASPSANRSARRRCASRAASSRRSPTSAPI